MRKLPAGNCLDLGLTTALCCAMLGPSCRNLKAAAEDVLSTPWDVLYSCQILRTSRGKGFGLLVCSYGLGWHLWPADEGEQKGRCVWLDWQ